MDLSKWKSDELNRVSTFSKFTHEDVPSSIRLAEAGFVFEGIRDEVVCFACEVKIGDWKSFHSPMDRHYKESPGCWFVSVMQDRRKKGNGLADGRSTGARPKIKSNHSDQYQCTTNVEQQSKYPEFSHRGKRYSSFNEMQEQIGVSKVDLVRSGFFFQREDDCVRCFHCGKGFQLWYPQNPPDVEHAILSPRCQYIESVRGKDFVDDVLKIYGQVGSPILKQSEGAFNDAAARRPLEILSDEKETDLRADNKALSNKTHCRMCNINYVSTVTECCYVVRYCYSCVSQHQICPYCHTENFAFKKVVFSK